MTHGSTWASGRPDGPRRGLRPGAAALLACAVLCVPSCVIPGGGSPPESARPPLTAEAIEQSIALCRQYLLRAQEPNGTFVYAYDFRRRLAMPGDDQTRQAVALWSLALLHQHYPSEETTRAIRDGLDFFKRRSALLADGRRYIIYPGTEEGTTNMIALVALTLVDYLRVTGEEPRRAEYEGDLAQYIRFLFSLRRPDGRFYSSYDLADGVGRGDPSGYSDGEALLLMVKAARYAGFSGLQEPAIASAGRMFDDYFGPVLSGAGEEDGALAFHHWGALAFHELYTSGWPGTDICADRALRMADWIMDVHGMLARRGNMACACEGLAVEWELARLTGRTDAKDRIGRAIEQGLGRLLCLQVGGAAPNEFIRQHAAGDSFAVGGVLTNERDPVLRIDMTQHAVDALLLARRFIYRQAGGAAPRGE